MPKIARRTIWIDNKDVLFEFYYNPTPSYAPTFSTKLPDWMASILGRNYCVGKTQAEVETLLREAIKEYGESKRTEEKVIFYLFLSQIRQPDFEGDNDAEISEHRTEMLSKGVAMDLWFRIGYVITKPTESREILVDENHKDRSGVSSDWGSARRMPYTPERYEFFLSFREWLVEGIERIKAFFKDSEKLPAMLDKLIQDNMLPFQNALPALVEEK